MNKPSPVTIPRYTPAPAMISFRVTSWSGAPNPFAMFRINQVTNARHTQVSGSWNPIVLTRAPFSRATKRTMQK